MYCDNCEELVEDCECERCRKCEDLVEENCECERCENCEDLLEDCGCTRCTVCEYLMENCECERCEECKEFVEECECSCDNCGNFMIDCQCVMCNICDTLDCEYNCQNCGYHDGPSERCPCERCEECEELISECDCIESESESENSKPHILIDRVPSKIYGTPGECEICLSTEKNCVLECGHFTSCLKCAQNCVQCPLCRKQIEHVFYGSYETMLLNASLTNQTP